MDPFARLLRPWSPWLIGVVLGLAAAAQLWVVVVGPRQVEERAVARYQREQRTLAHLAATRIDAVASEVRRRADAAARTEGASPAAAIGAARRPWDARLGILWFVNARDGRVIAVEPGLAPAMRARFLAHHHLDGEGGWHEGGETCPVCLAQLGAVSL